MKNSLSSSICPHQPHALTHAF
uniref:Uncharacterized protein n=1 Tax=Anguilla anguilla TaxID=7936 RepID=A0A0E9PHW9_ANGAN